MTVSRRERSLAPLTFVTVLAGVLLVYAIPSGSTELRATASRLAPGLLFPAILWVLRVRRAADPEHLEERRFWSLWMGFFALWLLAELVIAVSPEDTFLPSMGGDVLLLGSYTALALAAQQKPHEPSGWSTRGGSARFTAASTVVFMTGMFAYFVAIPFFFEPEDYGTFVPSFYLFLILDAVLALCFLQLSLRARARRWRGLYALLATALILWFVGDALDYLYFSWQIEDLVGSRWDLLYYAPLLAVFLATRVRIEPAPVPARAPFETPGETGEFPSALPLALASLVPLLHLSVDQLGFLGDGSRAAREITVSVALLALLALMFLQQRFMNRRNRTLRSQVAVLVTHEQILQAQKMEALGRLAGSVAHEFNNALLVIHGYCDLLLGKLPEGDPMCSDLEAIGRSADHVASLTRDLMAFGRRQPGSATLIDLSAELERCEDMLRRVTGDDVELVFQLEPGLAPVEIDAGQVVQVVMNLVINARAAMPGGGRMTIGTHRSSPEHALPPGVRLSAQDHVLLTVEDTGVGMDDTTRQHAFEPFFTTKAGGVGLGLATVHGIVSQCGGHVDVTTEAGAGTTFRIYFPASGGTLPTSAESRRVPAPSAPGRETVLLVEDEPHVRELIRQYLVERGYEVLVARDGLEALDIARARADVHLLLTDMVMPGLGGRELYGRIATPNLCVVFMSGYAGEEEPLVPDGRAGPWAFLQKPFSMDVLEETLREVLDRRPPG